MENEYLLKMPSSQIMEGDSAFLMANSYYGDLYLREKSLDFVAAGGILGLINLKGKKDIHSDVVKQKYTSIPLKDIDGLEYITHRGLLKTIATVRVYLCTGDILYFTIGNGDTNDTARFLDVILSQCIQIGLKLPFAKVDGKIAN